MTRKAPTTRRESQDAPAAGRPDPAGVPSPADPELAAQANAVYRFNDLLVKLNEWRWTPSTPAEVLAALNVLGRWSCGLGDRVEELTWVGDDRHRNLPEHVADLLNRVEELERRLAPADRITELERRIAELEARLDPDSPQPPDAWTEEEVGAQQAAFWYLWPETHNEDGGRRVDDCPPEGWGAVDLYHGLLMPRTWGEMLDVLAAIGDAFHFQEERRQEVADATVALQALAENLSRALESAGGYSSRDSAQRFALQTISKAHVVNQPKRAEQLQKCWDILRLTAEGDWPAATNALHELAKG